MIGLDAEIVRFYHAAHHSGQCLLKTLGRKAMARPVSSAA
jgi:hypothetical protein